MRSIKLLLCCLPWLAACAPPEPADPSPPAEQPAPQSDATVYEGARIIVGDGTTVENGAFVVEDGQITWVGSVGNVEVPAGATRVDLTGKTVMPALVDAHLHLGYMDINTMTDVFQNYSRGNIIEHLHRSAYHGNAAVMSMGIDGGDTVLELRDEDIPGAARVLAAGRGIARPNAGPGAADRRHIPIGIDTAEEARAAVRELAAEEVDLLKIWVDDRNGTVEKLGPELYGPIIDEAHRVGLRVAAHIFYLEDAKELLRAGVDGFAHGVRDMDVDDEFIQLLASRPYVFLIPNLPESGLRMAEDLSFMAQTMPGEAIEAMREDIAGAEQEPESFQIQARNLERMRAAGVTIAIGTDGDGAGWDIHEEMADMVASGLSPSDVIVAATSTPARLLRLHDLGTIASGKSADFLVLDADPLEDIKNTRAISSVYLRGEELDRETMARNWTGS